MHFHEWGRTGRYYDPYTLVLLDIRFHDLRHTRLDRDEPIPGLGLQHGLQLLGINPFDTLDKRFRVG